MTSDTDNRVSGICAVLGMDIVAFSTLPDEDQLTAIRFLTKWIRSALDYHEISSQEYLWSPAGDGGYLTFKTPTASEKALEVAFSILEKGQRPTWVPRMGNPIELRFGLHAGIVYESDELRGGTNIWGDGINMAARVLSVTANSQVLVSNQYFDAYLRNRREKDFVFGDPFRRTVKHGVRIFVRNSRRGDLGLHESDEVNRRWVPIGLIWRNAIESYMHLIDDAVDCDDPIAVLVATKSLLELSNDSKEAEAKANDIFSAIGESGGDRGRTALRHFMFNVMPSNLLRNLIEDAIPRIINKGHVLCQEGDQASSCYIPVYGALQVEGSNIPTPIEIPPGQIVGEFSLWIPNSQRAATIRAKEDSFMLEVPTSLFAKICEQSPDMAGRIHLLIRRRLLENVVKSKHFFPGIGTPEMERLLQKPSVVEKHAPGTRLALSDITYIIFQGKVRLVPPILEGRYYEVASSGSFSREAIVGVVTQDGDATDGQFADVLEESVTVYFDHRILLELFNKFPEVQEAWDGIWGRRHNNLLRTKGKVSTCSRLPATYALAPASGDG